MPAMKKRTKGPQDTKTKDQAFRWYMGLPKSIHMSNMQLIQTLLQLTVCPPQALVQKPSTAMNAAPTPAQDCSVLSCAEFYAFF
jgi:hypothetical protein